MIEDFDIENEWANMDAEVHSRDDLAWANPVRRATPEGEVGRRTQGGKERRKQKKLLNQSRKMEDNEKHMDDLSDATLNHQ